MEFRVTLSYPLLDGPPSEAAMDGTLDRLREVAPGAGPVLALIGGALEVTLAFDTEDAPGAISLAVVAAGAVLGGGATRVEAGPA